RLNKPFIVEEAGFDRRLFPDRTPKYQEHADRWYGLGARGYMPWGYIHTPEIGDGDNDVGVGANLDDFGALRSLFQGLAARVAAGVSGFAGLLPGPGAFGGLVGFDFRRYNQTFLAHDDPAPLNDAAAYAVQVKQADAPDEAPAWRVIGIHHLTAEENSGKHHVYVEALDEQGQRVREPGLRLEWGWEGQTADEASPPVAFDKGEMEPAANVPIERSQRLWVRIGGDLPSDTVVNLHANHPDEAAADGSTGNSIGHHSYYIVFQRGTRAGMVQVDAAAYVPGSDAVPDLTTLRPGARFIQRWTLRNTGTTAWRSPGYKLVWTGHKSLGAPPQVAVPACAPGEEVQVEVEQVAPAEAGVHLSTWQMSNPQDELFGDRVWTLIQVESQPAATLTPLRPLSAGLAGPAALPAPALPPPGSGEIDAELLPAWRKHIEQQLNNNQTMFQQILQGFMNPYWTTVWLYRILFGLGVAAFIVAAALAFSGRSGWTAALFGGISLASVLGFCLVRPLQALEENLQFITWLGLIYNTYWVHLTYANDPATVHEQVDKATADAITGIQTLMAKHAAAAAKRPWLRA
ncbi:MAG TPA: NBR1-Ig-like domain-containing protein, partial [Caldilineaceae bacterium]|nr:NBR1-Ig-like domain-containing protein [Caldilineaceae bacterium]